MNWVELGLTLLGGIVTGAGGLALAQKIKDKPAPAGREAYDEIAKKRLEAIEQQKGKGTP